MIASGTQPTPHARIISVRYRRGNPQRRDGERADRSAEPERTEREREGAGAAARLVFHRERQQHLDRTHDEEHEDDREHERREQPPGAQQVREPVAQVDERLADRMPDDLVEVAAHGGRAHQAEHHGGDRLQGGDDREGEPRPLDDDEQARERRTGGLHHRGPQHALDAVGGEQLPGREDGGQPRRVRRIEESVGDAEHEREHGDLPHLDHAARGEHRRDREREARARSRRRSGCVAAECGRPPPRRTAPRATSPRLAPTATYERSIGDPPSSTTCQTAATSHAPADSSDAASATTSRRYCPDENGRSARGSRVAAVIRSSLARLPADIRPRDPVSRRLSASHFSTRWSAMTRRIVPDLPRSTIDSRCG